MKPGARIRIVPPLHGMIVGIHPLTCQPFCGIMRTSFPESFLQ